MSCISIGKAIKALLVDGLSKTSIKNKIYPLIANETTTFPFIVYRRSSIIPESNKDYSNDSAYIQIMIAANNYAESVELAEQVRTSLVHKKESFRLYQQRIYLQQMVQKNLQIIRLCRI